MGDWPRVRLGEVVECLDSIRKPVKASDRKSGPYAYYGASGVVDHVDHYLVDGTYALVAEDGENLRTRNTPIAFLATGKFWVNNHAHILAGTAATDVRYLAYRIEASDVSGYLTGSTQPKLTQNSLLSMPFAWPPVEVQRAIAEVLGALDDKIDANLRLASLCESLAVAHVDAVRKMRVLSDFVLLCREQVKPETFAGQPVDHFSLPAFDSRRLPDRCPGDTVKSTKFRLRRPVVLVSKLNPHIPRVWFGVPSTECPAVASTEFVVLEPQDGWAPELIYAACARPSFNTGLAEQVTGTTGSHQRVRPQDVVSAPVADLASVPEAVRDAVVGLVRRALSARREGDCLAALRDTLLPPLVSGEIRVREAPDVAEVRG